MGRGKIPKVADAKLERRMRGGERQIATIGDLTWGGGRGWKEADGGQREGWEKR